MTKEKRRLGDPTKTRGAPEFPYTEEIAREICDYVALNTDSVKVMLERNPHFPCQDTIRRWRLYRPDFGEMYARAKQLQAELLAEEITEISDNGTNDYMEKLGPDGQSEGWKLNGEHVQRSRLRIDTRKWIACKLAPKLYGDKTTVESTINIHENTLKELA